MPISSFPIPIADATVFLSGAQSARDDAAASAAATAADRAQTEADAAATAADRVQTGLDRDAIFDAIEIGSPYGFDTVALLLANTSMGYAGPASVVVTAGQYVLAGGFRYQVAASGASDHHVTTAGGVKLYVQAPYDVVAFGAVGDGFADDTTPLQTAVTAARVQGGASRKLRWSRGTYLVTGQITLGTNQYIEFEPGVTINLVPSSGVEMTSLFAISNQSEVHLFGNGSTINGTRAGAVTEGGAAAFFIYGSENVSVCDFNINDMATDGITITGDDGASGPCKNILIKGCVVYNCRRNGMSIISAKGCTVIGGRYSGSNGAPSGPWAGVDVEPNDNCFIEDVVLIGVNTSDNDGAGLLIVPGALSLEEDKLFQVTVIGGRSFSDGSLTDESGLYFVNGGTQTYKIRGHVSVSGFMVDHPISAGVKFRNWDADKSPPVILNNVTVINPDSTANAASNLKRTGFVVYCETAHATGNLGNITIRNCRAEDTRASPRMVWGAAIGADSGKLAKNVDVYDFSAINYTSANKADVTVFSGTEDVSIKYPSSDKADVSSSATITPFGGKVVNVTVSGSAMTLPLASGCLGLTYHVQSAPSVDSVVIAPQSGDTILGLIDQPGIGVVLDRGGSISLKSQGGTSWIVERHDGSSRRAGTAVAKQIWWNTAAPVSGAWVRGDRVFNAEPSIGQPKSWVCTVAGSPGTWVSEGNL